MTTANVPELIDLEEFFIDPEFSGASISPDGTKLAYLAPAHGRTNVWVRGIDEEHEEAVCVTHDTRRGIRTYYWTDGPRWLLYRQDTDGNEDWHIYRVDLEAPEEPAVDLTPLPPGGRVVGAAVMKTAPNSVLVTMNKRPMFFDSFRIDVATGATTLHREQTEAFGAFVGPEGDETRFYSLEADDGSREFYAVDQETNAKRLILRESGPAHPVGLHPVLPTVDGTALLLGAYHDSDELRLIRVEHDTGEQTVVAAVPGHSLCTMGLFAEDFGYPPTLFLSQRTGDPIAARFVGDRPIIKVVDTAYEDVFAQLSKLSDGVLGWVSSDESEQRWVATFIHDREPDLTYFYDHSTGESRMLFRPYPNLDPADLAPMTGVRFTARDGLPLHGFLTVPVGVVRTSLPMVPMPHGGPWAHDTWGYNREVQFLANRGYAVLQVNFRGSTGYGKRHITAAIGELAGAMHNDLIDACDWAVQQGIADPSRIGIYGGSYGGYSALVGVTFTPDYFAAAVDYVGVSSWVRFINTQPEFVKPHLKNSWLTYAGDPDDSDQAADMLARSPITKVDEIRKPLLVVQGANDARVAKAESDIIVESLRPRGSGRVLRRRGRGPRLPEPRERHHHVPPHREALRPAPRRSLPGRNLIVTTSSIAQLSEEFLRVSSSADPFTATVFGVPGYDHAVPDLSESGEVAAATRMLDLASRAEQIAVDSLDDEGRVTRAVLIQAARAAAVPLQDRHTEFAVSGHASATAVLLAVFAYAKIDGPAGEANFLSRIRSVPRFLADARDRALAGTRSGLVSTHRGVEQTVERLRKYLSSPIDDDLILRPALGTSIEDDVRLVVANQIRPAFAEFVEALAGPILEAARPDERCGLLHLPDGPAMYARAVEAHTTTTRSPEEIHQLGLDMCAALREEFSELGRKVFGISDFDAVVNRLRSDPELRYDSAKQIVDDVRAIVARADEAVGAWFGRTYQVPCVVEPMNDLIAPTAVLGEYMPPANEENRPGQYNINTYQPHTRARYEYETLSFHEGVPGHHLQFALAQELDHLPAFRKYLYVTAFGEGWGLYSERLADEMGLYSSDLYRFGMVSFDAWRACRLVVDTGMHYYGWSRQEAIDFMLANSAATPENVVNEVDRYIAWPGQALAYMCGRLEIDGLKRTAMERLGSNFDIRGFHDAVLCNGSVPLGVLASEVNRWIDSQATAG